MSFKIFKYLLSVSLISMMLFINNARADFSHAQLEKILGTQTASQVISQAELGDFVLLELPGQAIFVSKDGKYVVIGNILESKNGNFVDIKESFLRNKLSSFEKDLIIYKANNEKYQVTIFSDITCHYCRLLHSNIKKYNDLGITIKIIAFPRGFNDSIAKRMETIFTSPADKRHKLLDQAMTGNYKNIAESKDSKLISKMYSLGVQFGLRGTPFIVASNGEVIEGYLEPKALLDRLNN